MIQYAETSRFKPTPVITGSPPEPVIGRVFARPGRGDDEGARGKHRCHHPRRRMIQYAAASRIEFESGDYWIPAFAGMTRVPAATPLSSSAKADDPVRRGVSIQIEAGDYWIPAFAGMTRGPRQTLLSSSAKADDPVLRDVSIKAEAGDYWIPAFAGMTIIASPHTPAPASASARHARSAFPAGCRGRD